MLSFVPFPVPVLVASEPEELPTLPTGVVGERNNVRETVDRDV
jgi:hypothetical protein